MKAGEIYMAKLNGCEMFRPVLIVRDEDVEDSLVWCVPIVTKQSGFPSIDLTNYGLDGQFLITEKLVRLRKGNILHKTNECIDNNGMLLLNKKIGTCF